METQVRDWHTEATPCSGILQGHTQECKGVNK